MKKFRGSLAQIIGENVGLRRKAKREGLLEPSLGRRRSGEGFPGPIGIRSAAQKGNEGGKLDGGWGAKIQMMPMPEGPITGRFMMNSWNQNKGKESAQHNRGELPMRRGSPRGRRAPQSYAAGSDVGTCVQKEGKKKNGGGCEENSHALATLLGREPLGDGKGDKLEKADMLLGSETWKTLRRGATLW